MGNKIKFKQCFKHYYEEMNEYLRQSSSELPLNQRIQNFIQFSSNTIRLMNQQKDSTASFSAMELNGFVCDLNKKITHYFIEDSTFENWLSSTKVKDIESVKDVLKMNDKIIKPDGLSSEYSSKDYEKMSEVAERLSDLIKKFKDKDTTELESKMENDKQILNSLKKQPFCTQMCIHTPENAFFLGSVQTSDYKNVQLAIFDNQGVFEHTPLKNEVLKDFKNFKHLNFAVNFLFYLKAFPEMIKDGVPVNIVPADKNKTANNMTVKVSPKIIEKTTVGKDGRIVTPHFRSGFFRYYRDDRYRNVKGTVQWIDSTMVKAKAKTVEKKEDLLQR